MIKQKLKPCKTCGDTSYIFSHGNCRRCWGIAKSKEQSVFKPLTQTESGKEAEPFKVQYQTKKIKKVSTRQQKLNAIYNTAAKLFKKANPVCKARIKCIGSPTTDVHHKRGRGEYLLDESTWLPVCRDCHIFIEQSPEQAKALGLSESRLSKAI